MRWHLHAGVAGMPIMNSTMKRREREKGGEGGTRGGKGGRREWWQLGVSI